MGSAAHPLFGSRGSSWVQEPKEPPLQHFGAAVGQETTKPERKLQGRSVNHGLPKPGFEADQQRRCSVKHGLLRAPQICSHTEYATIGEYQGAPHGAVCVDSFWSCHPAVLYIPRSQKVTGVTINWRNVNRIHSETTLHPCQTHCP